MYHPTTRVLAVLELLQTHGRMSGAEMAARLEIDGRTLRRYIVALEEMGIPITTERGRHGGYALMAGFKLPPMMFTDDEALALSIGLLAARSLGLAEAAPAVASAQAKLERIMPANLKRRVSAVDETVKLDLSQATSPDNNAALITLSAAAQNRQRVHLRYRSAQGDDSERDFDAYGLAYRSGRWYVVGMCHLRKDVRSFRLDRVRQVQLLAQQFTRPPAFDALAHLSFSVATIPRAFAIEVLLKTDLISAREHLFDAIGIFEQTEEGVLLHNQSDDLDWFARQLAHLPFAFEIHQPPALRDAVRLCAQRLLSLVKK
ncbi:putative DNA-binding transcriptional regulator YafY [Collimonas sp. PA-H2]|uniref:helix-turn-helix transcriptional regulator n=1 Tax=Collimonas sp. PA-H2 TaxID=1881062 RepID=UPI000BF76F94|nr:YafY family protein [Collimonas sp. PA-H2]PFH09886.1 putative DNA-binding transcriptional regulator YafY [Collimonas sp. PA-H2]